MNKKAVLSSLLLAFTSLTTASHGGSGGLFGLLANLPFPVDNWRQIAFSLATFGLIWFVVYIIVKKLIMRFELEDLFNMGGGGYGSSDGRNLGAVLSLLIVVSMAGASHTFLDLVLTIQQVLYLALGFGVVALIIAVVGGGFGGILWTSGKTAKLAGKGIESAGEGAQEFAGSFPDVDGERVKKQVGKVGNLLSRAKSEEQDVTSGNSGNPEKESDEAAHDIQKAIKLIEGSEKSISQVMKKDIDDFENALKDAEQVIGQDQKEERGFKDIKGRMDEINAELNKLNSVIENYPEEKGAPNASQFAGGIGTFHNTKGFNTVLEDIQAIEKDLQFVENLETKEEEELEDETRILVQELQDFVTMHNLILRIQEEIGEAEELDEYLEKISEKLGSQKVYGEAEQEEKELKKLESYYKELSSNEEQIESLIERAKNLINNEIRLEKEEIQEINILIKEEGPIFNQLSALEENIGRRFGNDIPTTEEKLKTAENELKEIKKHLEKIEQQNEQEEKAEERLFKKIAGSM